MSNTSATGGYLAPTAPVPDEDAALDRVFQQVVVGITGLAGSLVRPRYQPDPPPVPAKSVDWAAIGVTRSTPEFFTGAFVHNGTGNGSSRMFRDEILEVLTVFYGPNGRGFSARLRDGLSVSQNREALQLQGINLIDVGPTVNTADLANDEWVRRVDLSLRFRRRVVRTYPILNIEDLDGSLITERPTNPLGPLGS